MFSLQSAEFEPLQSSSHGETAVPIASLPVDITTLCRLDEPLPITFTEPSRMTMRQVVVGEKSPETSGLPSLYETSGFL